MRVQLLLAGIVVLAGCSGGPTGDEPGTGVVIKDVYTGTPSVESATPNDGNETGRAGTPTTMPRATAQEDHSDEVAKGDVDREDDDEEERDGDDGDKADDQEMSEGVGGVIDELVSQLGGSGDDEDGE